MIACMEFQARAAKRVTFDHRGVQTGERALDWLMFPEELRARLTPILSDYGYRKDDFPDADEFLLSLEYGFRDNPEGVPWALIFFDREYRLGGHLLSIRPNRNLRFGNYSAYNKSAPPSDPSANTAPPLSIVFVFSKFALEVASRSGSLLLAEPWQALRDREEDRHWAVVCSELDVAWVQETEKGDDDLFFKQMREINSE